MTTLSNKVVDTQELADPQVVVAGKLLTIKPGAPEIALLCRAIFRASFADDEDEALVNQKYQEWEEDRAKAIRAARFVLRALGGNGSVVRALRTTHSPSEAEAVPNDATIAAKARAALGLWLAWPDGPRDGCPTVTNEQVESWLFGLPARLATRSRPSKTVELLREAESFIADLDCECDSYIGHECRRCKVRAKLDSHLGEMK